MKTYKITVLALIFIANLTNCTSKGKPNKQGEILSAAALKALAIHQSMNGKLVTVDGYASFCGAFSSVTAGKKNKMGIYADGFCEGDKLIEAEIDFADNQTPLTGEEERNYAEVDKSFKNSTIKFMTDDYQEVANGKLKFSGTIDYDGSNYHLTNVTIHK
ncbi:hypothetical protein [Pedobacter xixiisoli]|uniref:Uncharacterized protein n=1 Tax=Pedobacter xixiisoli TaxID=1476464 RepID=A0A285ZQ18_9SPHI|nr:hypothetical protein [Pedobacter xixiisoli]SOD11756.1 hypothetical protein SAMN06297358_0318 [Pedobacter xixiisoli]